MGQIELNEGLAAAAPRKGDPPRNILGRPRGSLTRNREIAAAMRAEADKPCGVPGFEHMTNLGYTVWRLWDLAKQGDRFAVATLLNRMFGRVPLSVELDIEAVSIQQARISELENLSEQQLLARLDALRSEVEVIDAGP